MPLVRRKLVCFYCNTRSSHAYTKGLSQWHCASCGSNNYLDANGEITDPPAISSPLAPVQYARPASPPRSNPADEEMFCRTCLKNQMILTEALASYLPAPTDPRYAEFEQSLPAHKRSLEQRYPQVCVNCAPRVREKIRQAGYNAKTDHLRRMVERTRSQPLYTRRWGWKEWIVVAAGYIWWASVTGQVLWDGTELLRGKLGYTMDLEGGMTFKSCVRTRGLTLWDCSSYLPLDRVARTSILLGVLTFWWNNKLFEKLHTPRSRLVGLGDHITRHLVVLGARAGAWIWLKDQSPTKDMVLSAHAVLLVSTLFEAILSIRTVQLQRQAPIFLQTVDPLQDVSEAPPTNNGNTLLQTASQLSLSHTPFKPTTTPFSPMFPIDALDEAPAPPSPVSVATSRFNRDFETTSESSVDSNISYDQDAENAMDWTPTAPETSTAPPRYSFRKPATKTTTGLFASLGQNPPAQRPQDQMNGIAPNPFQSPIPAAPLNPARKLRNPPVTTGFRRASEGLQNRFFNQVMGLDQDATDPETPRANRTKRSTKELEPARFKLKEEEKTTGLEGLFDSVFSIRDPAAESNAQSLSTSITEEADWIQGQVPTAEERAAQSRLMRRLVIALFVVFFVCVAFVTLQSVWDLLRQVLSLAERLEKVEVGKGEGLGETGLHGP